MSDPGTGDTEEVVRCLLSAAGIHATESEILGLALLYPLYLRSIQAVHDLPELRDESPGTIFDPAPVFATWGAGTEST